jgi:hypothetical protein
MSEQKDKLDNMLIPAAITVAVAYFTGKKKTKKMAAAAKQLINDAIDDFAQKDQQTIIDVTPQKQLPSSVKHKSSYKPRIKHANKNH